jgi:hypothetical protein
MKVGRFTVKSRVSLEIMNQCDAARQAAIASKTEAEAVGHLKKIVRLLCTKWSSLVVFKRDLRRVDKILLAAGFNGEKSDKEYDPDWLVNLTSWFSAHLGGLLAYDIGCGMTPKEAERTAKEIGRKRLQDALRMVQIKISPETMLQDIEQELKRLTDNEKEETAVIENVKSFSISAGLRRAYQA